MSGDEKRADFVGFKKLGYHVSERQICMKSALSEGMRLRRVLQTSPKTRSVTLPTVEPDIDDFLAILCRFNAHWLKDSEASLPKAFCLDVTSGLSIHKDNAYFV